VIFAISAVSSSTCASDSVFQPHSKHSLTVDLLAECLDRSDKVAQLGISQLDLASLEDTVAGIAI
jgi:hypothetical protein